MSRFTSDMAYLDVLLTQLSMIVIPGLFKTLAVLVLVAISNRVMIIILVLALVPIFLLICYRFIGYNRSSLIEYENQNAISCNFSIALNNLVHIRSLGKTDFFR